MNSVQGLDKINDSRFYFPTSPSWNNLLELEILSRPHIQFEILHKTNNTRFRCGPTRMNHNIAIISGVLVIFYFLKLK